MPLTQRVDLSALPNLLEGEIWQYDEVLVRTGVNDGTVILPGGRGITFSSGSDFVGDQTKIVLPSAAGNTIRGVLVAPRDIEPRPGWSIDTNGDLGYPVKMSSTNYFTNPSFNVAYLVEGIIGVKLQQAVVAGDPVFCVHAATGRGTWRKDIDTANAISCPTFQFLKSGAVGAIVPLWVKF